MGCDIHTRCEVKHANNGWVMAGEIFDSPYDFESARADETLFATLTDGQLLDAIMSFYTRAIKGPPDPQNPFNMPTIQAIVIDSEKVRDLSEEAVKVLQKFHAARQEFARELGDYRRKINEEGWDYYGKVRPWEMRKLKELRDAFTLSDDVRKEIEKPVLAFRHDYGDVKEPYHVHLERAEGDPPFKVAEPYMERNYLVFAALANVRNGFGFAGVDTGEAIRYIDDARGVPNDCSPEWQEYVDDWDVDGHSHSWLTVDELESWEGWDQPCVHRAIVDEAEAKHFDETGEVPDLMRFDKGPGRRQIEWVTKLRDEMGGVLWRSIEQMKELAPDGDTEKVRMVFCFDN